jgi:hypothetical protein
MLALVRSRVHMLTLVLSHVHMLARHGPLVSSHPIDRRNVHVFAMGAWLPEPPQPAAALRPENLRQRGRRPEHPVSHQSLRRFRVKVVMMMWWWWWWWCWCWWWWWWWWWKGGNGDMHRYEEATQFASAELDWLNLGTTAQLVCVLGMF